MFRMKKTRETHEHIRVHQEPVKALGGMPEPTKGMCGRRRVDRPPESQSRPAGEGW